MDELFNSLTMFKLLSSSPLIIDIIMPSNEGKNKTPCKSFDWTNVKNNTII